jgi:hypothetical protein
MISREEAVQILKRQPTEFDGPGAWSCRVGPLNLVFPNFAWRRHAIRAHDLHHLMTGYPQTMRGEFQMAAWELGAGRYPHWGATLFCSPLLIMGALWSPSRMIAAYRAGRSARSLYSELIVPARHLRDHASTP